MLESQESKGRRKMSDPDISLLKTDNRRSEPIAIPSATSNVLVSPHTEGNLILLNKTHMSQFTEKQNSSVI